MKSKILLVSLGWIYYILPFMMFCSVIIIPFFFGYILGSNSTTKISDLFSVIVSFLTLWLAYCVALNWRPQLFATKFVEKLLQVKEDMRNIHGNTSEILASVRCEILNAIESNRLGSRDKNLFCNKVNDVLKETKHNSRKDLLNLVSVQDNLGLFDPDCSDKLKFIINRYREYYYVSCFSEFRISIKNKGYYPKKLGAVDILFSDCEFNVIFYLPDNVKVLSIENELRDLGVGFENGEFSGEFSLEKLDEFYEGFSKKFNEVRDDLVKEFDKYISKQMEPNLLR